MHRINHISACNNKNASIAGIWKNDNGDLLGNLALFDDGGGCFALKRRENSLELPDGDIDFVWKVEDSKLILSEKPGMIPIYAITGREPRPDKTATYKIRGDKLTLIWDDVQWLNKPGKSTETYTRYQPPESQASQ